MDETIDVLADWAPGLREALTGLGEGDFVIVDGTLIPIDRVATDEPYYSQRHRKHGMNVQAIALPDGTPLWFSRATPGRTHDLTAARAHGIPEACLTRSRPGRPREPASRGNAEASRAPDEPGRTP